MWGHFVCITDVRSNIVRKSSSTCSRRRSKAEETQYRLRLRTNRRHKVQSLVSWWMETVHGTTLPFRSSPCKFSAMETSPNNELQPRDDLSISSITIQIGLLSSRLSADQAQWQAYSTIFTRDDWWEIFKCRKIDSEGEPILADGF